MNATGLDRWGDAIPPSQQQQRPLPPPQTIPPARTCSVCGSELVVQIIGGRTQRLCPVHSTRGVPK